MNFTTLTFYLLTPQNKKKLQQKTFTAHLNSRAAKNFAFKSQVHEAMVS